VIGNVFHLKGMGQLFVILENKIDDTHQKICVLEDRHSHNLTKIFKSMIDSIRKFPKTQDLTIDVDRSLISLCLDLNLDINSVVRADSIVEPAELNKYLNSLFRFKSIEHFFIVNLITKDITVYAGPPDMVPPINPLLLKNTKLLLTRIKSVYSLGYTINNHRDVNSFIVTNLLKL
jgi:hypothetical protein